jgi:hypothetical protein
LFVRAIAGRIVPAILTTTAVAAGVATEEVVKILDSPYVRNRRKVKARSFMPMESSILPRWMRGKYPTPDGVNRAVTLALDRPSEISDQLMDTMRSRYRNAYLNLASSCFGFSAPAPPVEAAASGDWVTKWDFVEVSFVFKSFR